MVDTNEAYKPSQRWILLVGLGSLVWARLKTVYLTTILGLENNNCFPTLESLPAAARLPVFSQSKLLSTRHRRWAVPMAARFPPHRPQCLSKQQSARVRSALTLQTCAARIGIAFETSGSKNLVNRVLLRNWVLEVFGFSFITAAMVAVAKIWSTKLLKLWRAAIVTSKSTLYSSSTFTLPPKTLLGFTISACIAMFECSILNQTL